MQSVSALMFALRKRKEDPRFITGRAVYVDDIQLPGTLHLAILRSPYAHALVNEVDVSKALNQHGVMDGLTGRDVRSLSNPLHVRFDFGQKKFPRYALATDKVRYSGDPIAAILAATRESAYDALQYVSVDYEPLPSVTDPEDAVNPSSTVLYEQWGSNIGHHFELNSGDIESAFASAKTIISARFRIGRLAGVPIETRGVMCTYDRASNMLTAWCTSQSAHGTRTQLVSALSLDEKNVRVVVPDVGGAFGVKGLAASYSEYVLAALFAMRTGRPVKWIETRREHFTSTLQGRDQIHYVEAAIAGNGKIVGVKDRIIADLGAHCDFGMIASNNTAKMIVGNYIIPNLRIDVSCVVTNKAPAGAVRGNGRAEACFVIERMMDMVARNRGFDPAEIRMRNFPTADNFPFTSATGMVYDSGDYEEALRKALSLCRYSDFRMRQKELRSDGIYVGVGIACNVENSAFGDIETATIRVDKSGKVVLLTGSSPHGQGHETILAQVCAEELGVDAKDIEVKYGDTDLIPRGVGTFGSRSAVVGGSAARLAARQLKSKLLVLASEILHSDLKHIRIEDAHIFDGKSQAGIPLCEVFKSSRQELVESSHEFKLETPTFSNSVHVAIVQVDVDTGYVKVTEYYMVHDCGRVINPTIVEGQIHGGLAQGIGSALYENILYDTQGQPVTTTLTDYCIPGSYEIPTFDLEHMETLSPYAPSGVKGMGEGPALASPAAVINAVVDALSPLTHYEINEIPLRADVIWKILNKEKRD